MKVLFVCTANAYRSKTAEDLYRKDRPWHEYKSCGTNKFLANKYGGSYINKSVLDWADKIVCMHKDHWFDINRKISNIYNWKIETINIEDIYKYNDPELINELKRQINFL